MDIIYLILSAFAVLITLTVHEYFHGYAAYKLGDRTAEKLGRLSLNPLRHIDPIGALCMIFFHFGWAKPVPVNTRYFKNPKRDFAIVALAGPVSNFVLAIISAFIYLLIYALLRDVSFTSEFLFGLAENTLNFFMIFHLVNVGIGIFNMIPVPPLDGSRVLGAFLPYRIYNKMLEHERTIYYILIGWLLLGDSAAAFLLSSPIVTASPVLTVLAKILSLPDLLGYAIEGISSAIFYLFELIPFLKA